MKKAAAQVFAYALVVVLALCSVASARVALMHEPVPQVIAQAHPHNHDVQPKPGVLTHGHLHLSADHDTLSAQAISSVCGFSMLEVNPFSNRSETVNWRDCSYQIDHPPRSVWF